MSSSTTLFEKRKHRRNRSLSAGQVLLSPQPTVVIRHITHDMASHPGPPCPTPQFIPSRHATAPPPKRSPVLTHSISTPTSPRYFPSVGHSDSTAPSTLRSEPVSTPDDQSSLKRHHRSGFGKFFKKLGNKSDHHHHGEDHSVSNSSFTAINRTGQPLLSQHDHPSSFTQSKIPLAEPPSPLPSKSTPSIEIVGTRTYCKPDLCTALEESDSLLSTIPVEFRARRPPDTQQHLFDDHPDDSTNNKHLDENRLSPSTTLVNNNNTDVCVNPSSNNNSTSSLPDTITTKDMVTDPSQWERQQSMNDGGPDVDDSNRSSVSLLKRLSINSDTSIGKSSGCSSLYSTFGPDTSDSTLDVNSVHTLDEKAEATEYSKHLSDTPMIPAMPTVVAPALTVDTAKVIDTFSGDDSDDDSYDSDDEIFFDATGWPQEDIEREKSRLSKRLSGSHFGGAGDLILSITPASEYKSRTLLNMSIAEEDDKVTDEKSPASPPPPPPSSDDDDDEREAQAAAEKVWAGDESFIIKEKAAEWLGQRNSFNAKALVHYMDYLEFTDMRLDEAFRKLCTKLYFKAEAQQIDRILEAFARRYWTCNPQSILGDADIVYVVAYSLLLLNTDLHVVQGSHARMTRTAFVRNTLSTIKEQVATQSSEVQEENPLFSKLWEGDIEVYLKDLYTSVKKSQILQPLSSPLQSTSSTTEKHNSLLGGKKVVDFRRSVNSMITRKTNTTRLSYIFSSDNHAPTAATLSPTSLVNSPSSHSFEPLTPASTSTCSSPTMARDTRVSLADIDHHRPPHFQEGYLVRKHLLENSSQKAKHREWKEYFVVAEQGELKMYGTTRSCSSSGSSSPSGDFKNSLRTSSINSNSHTLLADTISVGNNNNNRGSKMFFERLGGPTMPLLETMSLNHSLSNALPPPGYNRQRPHVFSIQQPSGVVFLFQAPSPEQLNNWVDTCNYWAASQSKEPLPDGVSNMEYGCGTGLDDVILDLDGADGCG